jgi:hypothetical protein
MSRASAFIAPTATALLLGCGGAAEQTAQREVSYQSIGKADEAYNAKNYAEALRGFDEAIAKGGVQADVLAETYLKRGVCKMETGDLAGAADDLSKAEEGGAVGADYTLAMKQLHAKKAGS